MRGRTKLKIRIGTISTKVLAATLLLSSLISGSARLVYVVPKHLQALRSLIYCTPSSIIIEHLNNSLLIARDVSENIIVKLPD